MTGSLSRIGAVQVPITPIVRDAEVSKIYGEVQPKVRFPSKWRGFDYESMALRVLVAGNCTVITCDVPDAECDQEFLGLPTMTGSELRRTPEESPKSIRRPLDLLFVRHYS